MSGKKPTRIQRAALFAVSTIGIMALFFNLYDPWVPIGPDRIVDRGFETPDCTSEWTGWSDKLARLAPGEGYKNSTGVVLSATAKRHGVLRKNIEKTDHIPAFRVSVRAKAEHVQRGKRSYFIPRTVFFYRDNSGKGIFNCPHTVCGITKDSGWKQYSEVFPVPENIQDAHLVLQNLGTAGTFYVDDVSVIPVTIRPSAPLFQVFFTLLWIAAFITCLLALAPWKSRTGIGTLLCTLVIIVGVLLPGKFLDRVIVTSADFIQKNVDQLKPSPKKSPVPAKKIPKDQVPKPVQKKTEPKKEKTEPTTTLSETLVQNTHCTGHFTLFMMLAALSLATWAPTRKSIQLILPVLAGLTIFAASTEVLQFLTPDRKAGLDDMAVDLCGILIATVLTSLLTIPRRKRQAKPSQRP